MSPARKETLLCARGTCACGRRVCAHAICIYMPLARVVLSNDCYSFRFADFPRELVDVATLQFFCLPENIPYSLSHAEVAR